MMRIRPTYLIIANTALLIVVLQIGAYAFLNAYDVIVPAVMAPAMPEAVKRNYAHMAPEDFTALWRATRQMRFRFEPGVGLLQEAITSPLVNIDAHGIRANGPHPRPIASLEGTIWFLGGSTVVGDSIADHETIPAQVERAISRPVINLGVSGHASAAENRLLTHYLRIGYRPSLALFLDGINESCEPEPYAREMREVFRRTQQSNFWDIGGPLRTLFVRAVGKAQKIAGIAKNDDVSQVTCARNETVYRLSAIHSRVLAERDALCRAYQITCRTIVQPFSGTHGQGADLPRAFLDGEAKLLREIYQQLEPGWRAAGALFVTDVFDGYPQHPFVDEVHYSADASRVIAEAIVTRLALR